MKRIKRDKGRDGETCDANHDTNEAMIQSVTEQKTFYTKIASGLYSSISHLIREDPQRQCKRAETTPLCNMNTGSFSSHLTTQAL